MGAKTEHEARFVDRIKKIRAYRNISCQQLADLSGLTRVALSKIECGERRVSLGEAVQISDALQVSIVDMYSAQPFVMRIDTTID